jgi:hypothetical protein
MLTLNKNRIIDVNHRKVICDKEGRLNEEKRVLYRGKENYELKTTQYNEGVFINKNVTDLKLIKEVYNSLTNEIKIETITSYRKQRKQSGYYGITFSIFFTAKIIDKDELNHFQGIIDTAISNVKKQLNVTLSPTKRLKLEVYQSKINRLYIVTYRCFSRTPKSIDTTEIQDLFEDRFLDFDGDFKTQTKFHIYRYTINGPIFIKIKCRFKNKVTDEHIRRLGWAINWVGKLLNMTVELLMGDVNKSTLLLLKFKPKRTPRSV